MPEPERDIEKTLRAYATKRRKDAGAPAQMHPATRKLLQGEVARLRGKPEIKAGFWKRVFGGSWPQVALRVSVFTLLASVAVMLLLSNFSKPKVKFEMAGLRPRDEKTMKVEKETDKDRMLRYGSSAEISAPQKQVDSTIADQTSLKQARPSGETITINGNAAVSENARGSSREAHSLAGVPPTAPVIAQEKERLPEVSGILAEKTAPEPLQATPNNFDGLATSPGGNRSSGGQVVNGKRDSYAAAPTVAAPVPPASVAAGLANRRDRADVFGDGISVQPITPPATAPLPAASTAATPAASGGSMIPARRASPELIQGESKASANSFTQRFIRSDQPTNTQKTLKTPGRVVLRSFRVVKNGNKIRMIDDDGSVYSGYVGPPEEGTGSWNAPVESVTTDGPATRRIQTEQNNPPGIGDATQPFQNSYFHVSGTNRSLKQLVVFTGNFAPDSSPAKSIDTNGPAGNKASMPNQMLKLGLQGRAVVGGTNQIEIIALPIKP